MARSLFKLRNISCFLIDLRLAMSVGSSRAYSTALAMYPALPYQKSLIEASLGKRAPSSTREGAQVGTSICWSPLLSMIAPSLEDLIYMTLACLPPLQALASLGGRFLHSSITSFPFQNGGVLICKTIRKTKNIVKKKRHKSKESSITKINREKWEHKMSKEEGSDFKIINLDLKPHLVEAIMPLPRDN